MNVTRNILCQIYNIVKNEPFLRKHIWSTHVFGVKPENVFYFIENGVVCSFILVKTYKRDTSKVRLWVVASRFKRKGYASKVLDVVKQYFKGKLLFCECRDENYPMNMFLKKHEFSKVGEKFVGKNNDIKVNVYMFDNRKTLTLDNW